MLADAPSAVWRLAETTGPSAGDSAGTNPGTWLGGVVLGQAGALANGDPAALFNGSSAHIRVANSAPLQLSGDLTIEMWIHVALGTRQTLLSKGYLREFECTLESNGALNLYQGNGTTYQGVLSTDVIAGNAWQHIVVTRVASTKTISFTVNGVSKGSGTYTTAIAAGTQSVVIGRSDSGGGIQYVNGRIDEIALYPSVLTASQIAAHYARRTADGTGTAVSLPLLATDGDGDPLTYSASGLPPGLTLNTATGLIAGTLGVGSAGTHEVTAAAADATLSDTEVFTWTVAHVNGAPILTSPAHQSSAEGASISLSLAATDPDGSALTYSATGLPPSLTLTAATGVIAGTLPLTSAGVYTVVATASDGTLVQSQGFTWTVTNTNQAPTLVNPGAQTRTDKESFGSAVLGHAPAGYWSLGELTGSVAGDGAGANAGVMAGGVTLGQAGALADASTAMRFDGATGYIQVPHASGLQAAGDLTLELWIHVSLAARQTLITKGYLREFELTLETNGTLNLYQGNGTVYSNVPSTAAAITAHTWQHVIVTREAATQTVRFFVNGVARGSGVSATTATAGTLPVSIGRSASHNQYVNGTLDEVAIYRDVLTPAQVATHYALRTADGSGTPVVLALSASDPDADALTYAASGLPPGLSLHASTGIISGTLTPASVGTHAVTATASDGTLTHSQNFTWTVTHVNRAPMLTSPGAQTSAEGAPVSLPLLASDPEGTALTYSASGLPPSVWLNAATGLISGTLSFTSAGTHTVTAAVSDGTLSHSQTFTWTVTNTAPSLAPLTDMTREVGTPVSIPVTVVDPDSDPLTFGATNLPAGVTIDASTGLIAGTPTVTGTHQVAVSAQDGHGGAGSTAFTLVVSPALTGEVTITTVVFPAANAAGWHHMDVTVTFLCANASSCPAPVTVTEAGTHVVSGTATNTDHSATATVTVRLDRTPAVVSVSAPADGTITDQPSLVLTGLVSDSLSGLASATCGAVVAAIVNGAAECTVPLRPGVNSLVLHAMDHAGNSASSGIRVTRTGAATTLAITPQTQSLVMGESRAVTAASEYGVVSGVTWASSDPSILSVSADGEGVVTGQAPGVVTLSAVAGGLSAESTVTVVGVTLAPGSSRWTLTPVPGLADGLAIPAHRVDDIGPDMFMAQTDSGSGLTIVRALRADGTQLSTETISGQPLVGDSFGGVLALVTPAGGGSYGLGITRIGGPPEASPWRYDAPIGPVQDYAAIRPGVAQAPDGTIYFVEDRLTAPVAGGYNGEGYLVGLDGHSGAVKFRIPLPLSTWTFTPGLCSISATTPSFHGLGSTGPITMGTDGAAYVEIFDWRDSWAPVCEPYVDVQCDDLFWAPECNTRGRRRPGEGTFAYSRELKVLRVDSAGATAWQTLRQWNDGGPDNDEQRSSSAALVGVYPGVVTPDGADGMLASWTLSEASGDSSRISRVFGGATTEHLLPAPTIVQLTDKGIAYLQGDQGALSAVDVTSWATTWTRANSGPAIIALDGGRVVMNDGTGLTELDQNGVVVATTPLSVLLVDAALIIHGQRSLHGIDALTGSVTEVVTSEYREAASYFIRLGPQSKEGGCKLPPFSVTTKGLLPRPGVPYTYLFADDPTSSSTTFSNEQKVAVESAFTKWSAANVKSGLNTTFIKFQPEGIGAQNITLFKRLLPIRDGRLIPAETHHTAQPDGTITGSLIYFNSNENVLRSPTGYLKAALHEIGHNLGLGHAKGFGGSSVMNDFGAVPGPPVMQRDDFRRDISDDVTECDRKNAKLSSTRSWPPQ